jgi:transposase
LVRPWRVESVAFDEKARRLDLALNYERGGTFPCPECGRDGCKAYDSTGKEWRHLNFFQHEAYLHAPVPRVECPEHGIKQIEVPWARTGSGFTLLFEALVMMLVREMPVAAVARIVGEHDTRLWRILKHHVGEARAEADYSEVRAVGLDETASRRGHNYITLFADLDEGRLLYATEGRDAKVLGRFRLDLLAHGGTPEQIEELCMDMLPAYLKGAAEQFPEAEITFDKFHVLRLLNAAVDEVRREEQKERWERNGRSPAAIGPLRRGLRPLQTLRGASDQVQPLSLSGYAEVPIYAAVPSLFRRVLKGRHPRRGAGTRDAAASRSLAASPSPACACGFRSERSPGPPGLTTDHPRRNTGVRTQE